jgi:hypothetical protein
MSSKSPFQWDELITIYFWTTQKWRLKQVLKRGIQFKKSQQKGWYYLSIYGWLPFKWACHGGHFCMSFKWFWRFAVTVPRQRGWRWD